MGLNDSAPPPETCDHCGRTDVGTWKAGRAVVKLAILDPHDRLHTTLEIKTLVVCDPRVADRPKCKKLVANYRHERHCRVCRESNPPGTELKYKPRLVGQRTMNESPKPPLPPSLDKCPHPQEVPAYIQRWARESDRSTKMPGAVVEAVRRGLLAGWTIGEIAAAIGVSTGRIKSMVRRNCLTVLCTPGRGGKRLRQKVTLFDPEDF